MVRPTHSITVHIIILVIFLIIHIRIFDKEYRQLDLIAC
jgi:hypothetical protein